MRPPRRDSELRPSALPPFKTSLTRTSSWMQAMPLLGVFSPHTGTNVCQIGCRTHSARGALLLLAPRATSFQSFPEPGRTANGRACALRARLAVDPAESETSATPFSPGTPSQALGSITMEDLGDAGKAVPGGVSPARGEPRGNLGTKSPALCPQRTRLLPGLPPWTLVGPSPSSGRWPGLAQSIPVQNFSSVGLPPSRSRSARGTHRCRRRLAVVFWRVIHSPGGFERPAASAAVHRTTEDPPERKNEPSENEKGARHTCHPNHAENHLPNGRNPFEIRVSSRRQHEYCVCPLRVVCVCCRLLPVPQQTPRMRLALLRG